MSPRSNGVQVTRPAAAGEHFTGTTAFGLIVRR